MDSQLDVSLLVKRFSSLSVDDVGVLVKDFFCARSVGSGTYGGRLYVMNKSLVFISAYSNSRSYDCCIPLSDITMATTLHKGITSAVELEWTKGKECFTNFYDLKAVEGTLQDILGPLRVVVKHLQVGVSRMFSVPAREPSPDIGLKPAPCHFFSKCGFCPRRVVCKLDHTYHTKPPDAHVPVSLEATPTEAWPGHAFSAFLRSPSKKPHIQDPEDLSSGRGLKREQASRSTSLPTPFPDDEGKTETGDRMETPAGSHSSDTQGTLVHDGADIEDQNGMEVGVKSHSNDDKHACEEDSAVAADFQRYAEMLTEARPKSFDFSSQLSQQHSVGSGDEFHTPEGDFEDPAASARESVFVFSGSGSGRSVQSKRRGATVTPVGVASLVEGVGPSDGGEAASREVAVLAQQFEFCSDDDSLHGDLDIEAQMRIMESFSHGNDPSSVEPPPPYSSVVPHPFSPSLDEETSSNEEGRGHKRQPCSYFLSGYCQKGTECPDYHGVNPDLEELEYDEISLVPIPAKIKVHSGVAIGRGDINSGDKIILPPHVLISCEQQNLAYPMAFKMESTISGKVVYGGVLQFTSPAPDSAYLPQWMMDHLQVQNGEEVAFKHVDLPKGTFVQLQPVSSSWLAIPYDKRMAVMEFQLRNFQTLTEGTKVTLTYELNRYTLKVLQCRPAQGISIVDSDLTTDVIEPADLQRFHSVEDGQAEHLGLDETKTCTVKGEAFRHFVLLSLPGKPLPSKLRVKVESLKGDADLFLSQSYATPTQSRYTWCNQEIGRSEIHMDSLDEKSYNVDKPLYIGVMGVLEDAEFTIAVHSDEGSASTAKGSEGSSSPSGQTLRGVVSSGEPPTGTPSESEPLPPGHQRCSHCGSVMPSLRLLLHERHCVQSTFKCPLCQVCLPKVAERKHNSISHRLLVCECGEEHSQLALHRHQELDCNKRMVNCPFKWCNLSFPTDQLSNHEHICGRKKVECPVCGEEVSQLELEMHLEAFHNVETESIDWGRPIGSQTLQFKQHEPKFKCPCGEGFEFQDDMQVHQLTECAFRRMAEDQEVAGVAGLLPEGMADDIVG